MRFSFLKQEFDSPTDYMKKTALVLDSGKIFLGKSFGKVAPSAEDFVALISDKDSGKDTVSTRTRFFAGEVVFNTAMSGYVEVLTDPSFSGQLVCMTYPHIGNYGVDTRWSESGSAMNIDLSKANINTQEGKFRQQEKTGQTQRGIRSEIQASGFIVKDVYQGPVPEGRITLDAWMKQEGICGISGIDTRALTLYLRDNGAENGVIVSLDGVAEHDLDMTIKKIVEHIHVLPSMEGRDLVKEVGLKQSMVLNNETHTGQLHVGILDFGCKHNIIRLFEERNCKITLFKDDATADDVLSKKLDMVLVSNGPGDPAVLAYQKQLIQALVGKITLCGICLGTQLLALSIGATTYKLPFGHHGINHPVKDVCSKQLFITSQNHGFAVDANTLPKGASPWFINTNDNTLEGFIYPEKQMYSVQFHPEAAPGPVDSLWIIDYFLEQAKKHGH